MRTVRYAVIVFMQLSYWTALQGSEPIPRIAPWSMQTPQCGTLLTDTLCSDGTASPWVNANTRTLPTRYVVAYQPGGEQQQEQQSGQANKKDPQTSPLRILFAGSSSTYWNDLPNEVAKILSKRPGLIGNRQVAADVVGRSGSDIRVYLDPKCEYQYGVRPGQSFLEKVHDERFDYVVLMTVCRFIMGDDESNQGGQAHREAIIKYCHAIRAAGGQPVFYEMGWGTSASEAEGRRRILRLAKENDVRIFVPCSTAWARVRKERSDLQLQHPNDSSHPGDLGHYLNLACFYSAFVQQSPEGVLPLRLHVWPHLTKEEKETLKSRLDEAYASFKPDAYQARLPEWMRRNAGAGYEMSISEADALYLSRIAWATWQDTQAALTSEDK